MELSLFSKYQLADTITTKAVKHLNERNLILKDILELINSERVGTKYKQLTGRGIAIKVSHIPTSDLYAVHSMGKDYKNRKGSYSKYFFGAMKIK